MTNASLANAEQVLDEAGIHDRFGGIIRAIELTGAKPHPLPYLIGLELLEGRSKSCVAFEDSHADLRSAVSARLQVAGTTSGPSMAEIPALRADRASTVDQARRLPLLA